MMLGLQPPRYVIHPHYAEKLKQLLELSNDIQGGMPLKYDIKTLEVSHDTTFIPFETQHGQNNVPPCVGG